MKRASLGGGGGCVRRRHDRDDDCDDGSCASDVSLNDDEKAETRDGRLPTTARRMAADDKRRSMRRCGDMKSAYEFLLCAGTNGVEAAARRVGGRVPRALGGGERGEC
jgi:hypothetical protein